MLIRPGNGWETDLWTSPYRLRFGLGEGGDVPVGMFTESFDRARQLARAALPVESILAIIAAYPVPRSRTKTGRKGRQADSGFDLLAEMGVATEPSITWNGYVRRGDQAAANVRPWPHRACYVGWRQAEILLWNQIARELGVSPQAPVATKLIDERRGVCVFAYDDRGMDVTALSADAISPLCEQFDSWLLDYDRPRMAEVFALA